MPKSQISPGLRVGEIDLGGNMACREAPLHLVVTIQDGLIDDDMGLGAAVVVEVAPHRRDADGWPALMVGALVVAPDMPAGVPAVWASGEDGGPVHPVDGAAREYWAGESSSEEALPGYPEAEEARRCLPAPE